MTVQLPIPASDISEAATGGTAGRGYAISDDIVTRPSRVAARLQRICAFRLRPLPSGFGQVVVTVDDGLRVSDHIFAQHPTAQELVERAGPFAFVLAVRFQRPGLRHRLLRSVRLIPARLWSRRDTLPPAPSSCH